jgi:hypothetical protein
MADPIVAIPLYDPVIMGNPFYIWIIIVMGAIIFFGAILFKTEVYDLMQPVWGFRDAAKGNRPVAIINGMNGKIWMESLEYVAAIFKSMVLPLKWIITAPVTGQLGKVNTIYVSDDWNIVHNLDIDYAIVEIVHKWNEKHQKVQVETEEGIYEVESIHDWATFQEHLMNGDLAAMLPTGVTLPPLRVVDLHEIRRYLPKWTASHHSGYIESEVADRREGEEKAGQELLKYFIVGCFLVLLVIVGGYLLLSQAKCVS